LPAYLLGREALTERGTGSIRSALVPIEDRLLVAARLAGSHQDVTRPRAPGRVDLFLAPHSEFAAEVLEEALDVIDRGEAPPLALRAAVYRDRGWKLAAPGGVAEVEAMLREVAVAALRPGRLAAYLRARLGRVGSSYWRDALLEAGLEPGEVRAAAEGPRALAFLDADAQALAELGAGGPVVLLVSNQELVPVSSRAEARHVLAAAGALAEKKGTAARPLARSDDEVVELLVRALEQAPDPARARITRGLAALTGEDLGDDALEWRERVGEDRREPGKR
jgi:hypothetical protein